MLRKIIQIDEQKCNGCGLCVTACHEGAIGLVSGKAKLLREDYCDGLGDCLPACPMNAISFEMREAPAYDHQAVLASKQEKENVYAPSRLQNFPVQLKLIAPNAPWLENADLLIAADCTAFCYGNFHNDFIRNKVVVIGCPKLDGVQYAEKLSQIFENRNIRSVTLVRMQVPCCGGLSFAAKTALAGSGKSIPYREIVLSPTGQIVSQT